MKNIQTIAAVALFLAACGCIQNSVHAENICVAAPAACREKIGETS